MRLRRITSAIQDHDRELFAKEQHGRIDILRKGYKYEAYELDEDTVLQALKRNDYLVMSLTDTWNALGNPVDWGLEPIVARLRAMDLWRRDIAEEQIRLHEKDAMSQDRDMDNNIEAYLKENRRAIAKHWGDINTSTLDKRSDRRFKDEKKINSKG